MARPLLPAALVLALSLAAQTPTFEVASLKPIQITGDLYNANLGSARHGEVTLTNATLSDCLRFAYSITNDAQLAGPDWIRSKEVRFDILGKAAPDTPEAQLRLMLQTLLTERFKLVLHHEQRELAYLALTVGKSGPRLPIAIDAQNTNGRPQIRGRIISTHLTMTMLTTLLSRFLRDTVLDQTGLPGAYQVNLVWTPENTPEAADGGIGPSIYTAVREQLGLKLESRKGPVEVIVIDQAQKVPLEN